MSKFAQNCGFWPPEADTMNTWREGGEVELKCLHAKFHLNVFIVSASGDQKPQFWAIFNSFRSSCTDILLPIRVKFGVLEQTQGLHLPAKFDLNVFLVSASGDQKPQF